MNGTLPGGDPLAALRPLHAPAPVDWWPPAPGWWLLAAVLFLLLPVLAWWLRRRWWLRRAALAELQRLARGGGSDSQFAAGVNQLLHRVALACFPREQVAALSGDAWLAFLDAQVSGGGFVDGPGQVLSNGPYRADAALDRDALVALARRWIRQRRGSRA